MQSPRKEPQEILNFWFGPLDPEGWASQPYIRRWFKKDPDFDHELRETFLATHAWVHAQDVAPWQDLPQTRMAYIVLLDQMSRNMFRGQPGMFESDPLALAASQAMITQGWDTKLPPSQRVFAYMPLMHAESLPDQEQCVASFAKMLQELDSDKKAPIESNLHFAKQHRDIIARFGRFPHRNAILGRSTTPEEAEFLTQPGSSF